MKHNQDDISLHDRLYLNLAAILPHTKEQR